MSSFSDEVSPEVRQAIEFARHNPCFFHFVSANDTGTTGSHQCGFLIPRCAWPVMFDQQPERHGPGNPKRQCIIRWQDGDRETTEGVFTYYRTGTRNEYRLTSLQKGYQGNSRFERLDPDRVGELLVLGREGISADDTVLCRAWSLRTDRDISDFLDAFGFGPSENNRMTSDNGMTGRCDSEKFIVSLEQWASQFDVFPSTAAMSSGARMLFNQYGMNIDVKKAPDKLLLQWMDTEYRLFKILENNFFIKSFEKNIPDAESLKNVDNFFNIAQNMIQRRKSRAGKSFESHLAAIFSASGLSFSQQCVTELNKKPDFIFPSCNEYHNTAYPADRLIVLGAKTTCKDRWRQVISEADRVSKHYLVTLQQGISSAQICEMQDSGVQLVVPQEYLSTYPAESRSRIMTIRDFIRHVEENVQTTVVL